MGQNDRITVKWTSNAETRLEETMGSLADQWGDDAALSVLALVGEAEDNLARFPLLGKPLENAPHSRILVLSRGWEIVYRYEESNALLVILEFRRGLAST
jgi:plasmid stabilization system protein ParE